MNTPECSSESELPLPTKPVSLKLLPSLLPAFNPCSGLQSLPRTAKRKFDGIHHACLAELERYPTPEPSSSTAILSSSPPPYPQTRPAFQRTISSISERAPLSTVPSVLLSRDGTPTLMGRSSNSSHYQLSANRLVSRVHVKAVYLKPSHEHKNGEVVVECLGWNGAKVRCQSQVFELGKGDSFASDKPLAEIIVDVQDSRVILRWPDLRRERSASISSNSTWDEEEPRSTSPSTPSRFEAFPSSPPLEPAHLHSPVSPSPRLLSVLDAASTFLGAPAIPGRDEQQVAVYEDHAHDDEDALACPDSPTKVRGSAVVATLLGQQSSSLSDGNDFSDCDEENDPVVLSFGPAGENLLPRLESFTAASPNPAAALLNLARPRSAPMSPIPPRETFDLSPIKNHVINQLAFSRLHSLPLSTILNNLPATMRQPRETSKVCSLFSDVHLKNLLDDIPCIGEIVREGKDAAGKALEDEFYYMPERDQDDGRRSAVDSGLGKTSLRAVRKQHKQYYWKRPRY